MIKYLPYAKYIAAGLGALVLAYNVGYNFGHKAGRTIEAADTALVGAEKNQEAVKEKAKTDAKFKNRSHSDNVIYANERKWLRSDADY